jgi:predicted nicotinamide N-methyase
MLHDSPMDRAIRAATVAVRPPLTPEIFLRLAVDPTGIFADARLSAPAADGEPLPPYWAFAWPAGQATARHLLDHPHEVAGQRVLDIGAGCGIAAIAAAMAGAAKVLAADIDPFAAAAITINAHANGVNVETTTRDVLGEPPPSDLVLVGDLAYEPALAMRLAALLEAAASRGTEVLLADRTSVRLPHLGNRRRPAGAPAIAFQPIAEYDAPLTPALPAHPFERARLWRLQARPSGPPARR